jgi:hypothetical protein
VSARMAGGPAGPANDWQQLWLLAEPQPASAQRPLLNPQKEGELVSGGGALGDKGLFFAALVFAC